MRVTIRAIAAALGMSPSTVSQALNNKGTLALATRERVIGKARELGYDVALDPFGLDRTLSGRPVWFVLAGTPTVPNRTELAVFSRTVLLSVEQAFAPYNARLLVVPELALQGPLPDDLIGVIVAGSNITEDAAERLRYGVQPAVTVGCHLPHGETLCAVTCDGVEGIRTAVAHFHALGHRRITFLNGPPTLRASDEKQTGYIRGCADYGLATLPIETVAHPWDLATAERAAHSLLTGAWRDVTAVVCAYEQLAVGTLRAAQRLGRDVPGALSIVGFHDEGLSATTDPPLTTLALPAQEMGKLAARLIVSARRNKDVVGSRVVLSPRFVVRRSTAPVSPGVEP